MYGIVKELTRNKRSTSTSGSGSLMAKLIQLDVDFDDGTCATEYPLSCTYDMDAPSYHMVDVKYLDTSRPTILTKHAFNLHYCSDVSSRHHDILLWVGLIPSLPRLIGSTEDVFSSVARESDLSDNKVKQPEGDQGDKDFMRQMSQEC